MGAGAVSKSMTLRLPWQWPLLVTDIWRARCGNDGEEPRSEGDDVTMRPSYAMSGIRLGG